MTTLTLSTIVIIIYGVVGRRGYGRALALGGATSAGAAFVAGTTAVPTFYAVALGTAVAVALQLLGGRNPREKSARHMPPGVSLLLLFLAWSVLVTLTAPLLFDGTAVATPAGSGTLISGVVTSSNIAQIIYLVLGICVVVFLARSPHAGPELIGLAVGTTTVLSMWRYLNQNAGVPFPEGVFDNSPFFAYIETAPGGIERFRGILSEPSALAGSSLVTISYMLSRAPWLRGWRRALALAVAAMALYLGVISTSTTFVVAGAVVAGVAGLTFAVGFLLRRTAITAFVGIFCCAAVIVALWVLPIVADFVQTSVDAKVSSASFDERSGSNAVAYDTFLHTFGFGVGLGSTRASSFFAGLIATTGLLGALLLAAGVVCVISRSAPVREYRPVVWALVTSLVLKVIAGPDLSDSSGVLWMSLGLLSHAALIADARRTPSQFLGSVHDDDRRVGIAPIAYASSLLWRRRQE